MDAIIDQLVVTIHAEGSTRLPPDEIRSIVAACLAAMRSEGDLGASRREDVTPKSAYDSQILGI